MGNGGGREKNLLNEEWYGGGEVLGLGFVGGVMREEERCGGAVVVLGLGSVGGVMSAEKWYDGG